MKKILVVFALFAALIFVIGCGSGSKTSDESVSNFGKLGQECYPNKSCDDDLICDEETNRCIENSENPVNDSDIENSDADKPTENNDKDNPTENNDDDKPVDHNDNDNPIEDEDTPITDNDNIVNDNDPIENNDNDDEPGEQTDNDTPLNDCAPEDVRFTADGIQELTPEEIQESVNYSHNANSLRCYGSFTEKEKTDTQGNLCIEDECNIGPNDIAQGVEAVWIDNLPLLIKDTDITGDIVSYKKVEKLNQGSPTDLTIKTPRMTIYAKNIPTTSCFAPNDIVNGASTITMTTTTQGDKGCYADGQSISPSEIVATKNIQPKIVESDFKAACKKVPNSTFYNKTCSTTITEFAWLENVVPYLHDKSGLTWREIRIQNTQIEKDVDNNVFRMYFAIGTKYSWVVELSNAKRCLDECYGIEGCEVSINPSANISNGCNIKEP